MENSKKSFSNRCVLIIKENTALKVRVNALNLAIKKFRIGRNSLDMLLANQCQGSAKFGLGYVSERYRPAIATVAGDTKKSKKNSFSYKNNFNTTAAIYTSSKNPQKPLTKVSSLFVVCAKCNKFGHTTGSCRKDGSYNIKQVWMPKASTYTKGGTTWVFGALLSSSF